MEITGGSNRRCLNNLAVEFCFICGVRTTWKIMELTAHESLNKHLCSARKVMMSELSDKCVALKMAQHGSFYKTLLLRVQIKGNKIHLQDLISRASQYCMTAHFYL